jgi:methylisocitrate lyase
MTGLRPLIAEEKITVAPFVFDGLSALMATEAGFEALYLSGGSLGYMKAVTEANLTVTEMAAVGVDIASVCKTPLILDGAAGWGDPMHLRRTIALAERAGFGAIEIEDQILPKRAHHHIGVEHLIPAELMAAKIVEAVAARMSPDFVIIGRSNAARHSMDEALSRAEAYRKAGADMILSFPTSPEQMRILGERLGPPLVFMIGPGMGTAGLGVSFAEMVSLGFRLIIDAVNPLIALREALFRCYASIARGATDPTIPNWRSHYEAIMKTVGLDTLLEIERRTVEK